MTHFLNCGVDKVLLKPLDMEAFVRAMKKDEMTVEDITQDRVIQRDITNNDVSISQKKYAECDTV